MIHLTVRTCDPDDFLYIGDYVHDTYDQGFGTFVIAGDLSPFVGDDIIIIDPLIDSPDPLDAPHVHEWSGMLYEFYEGSTGTRPLTMFPQHTVIDACDSQQYFTAAGGVEPYIFSFLVSRSTDAYRTVTTD